MNTLLDKIRGGAVYLFLGVMALLSVFPFGWMVISATNASRDIIKGKITAKRRTASS